MNDTHFSDAIRPIPWYVHGKPLLTYSLGHDLLLLRVRSPFLLSSPADFAALPGAQQIFHIDQAVDICSNTWKQNQGEPLVWLKEKILHFRRRKYTRDDYALAIADFHNYLNAGRAVPRLSKRIPERDEKPGRELGSPLLAQLHKFVLELPDREGSPWDFSFSEAAWRYFMALETEGCVNIENASERENREATARLKAEYEAEQKAKTELEVA